MHISQLKISNYALNARLHLAEVLLCLRMMYRMLAEFVLWQTQPEPSHI